MVNNRFNVLLFDFPLKQNDIHFNFSQIVCIISATTCCTQRKTKKTKSCCTPVETVTTNKRPIRIAFMWTKLCTKLSKFCQTFGKCDESNFQIIFIVFLLIEFFFSHQRIDAHRARRNIRSNATSHWRSCLPKMWPQGSRFLSSANTASWRRNETLLCVH